MSIALSRIVAKCRSTHLQCNQFDARTHVRKRHVREKGLEIIAATRFNLINVIYLAGQISGEVLIIALSIARRKPDYGSAGVEV